MDHIKTTAEYYRRGLLLGLDLMVEAMAWIDRTLLAESVPDIALIEASLSGRHGPLAVTDWLAQIPGEFDTQIVARYLLRAMLARIDRDPAQVSKVAYWLFWMAVEDEWPDLVDEDRMWAFWDDFDLAKAGMCRNGDLTELCTELRGFLLRAALLTEVALFQQWAAVEFPNGGGGEWECDYDSWQTLWPVVLEFVKVHPFSVWCQEETKAVLYALARDNEDGVIADDLPDDLLLPLTRAAIEFGEKGARWQLANALGRLEVKGGETEEALLTLAYDEEEYVRRMALKALAQLGSASVERLALEMWERPDPYQEYTRMMVLCCLQKIGSPRLEPLLAEAEQDTRPYLRAAAERIRRGEKV